MPEPVWNTLEIAKLAVGILIPVTVVLVGFLVNRRLQDAQAAETRRFQGAQWANQKVIEQRLKVYEKAAPLLNDLYCYFRWRGSWKEFTPAEMIMKKRTLDSVIFVNEFLFSPAFMALYLQYIDGCFQHYAGPTSDARLRTWIVRGHNHDRPVAPEGATVDDRREAYKQRGHGEEWKPEWDQMFAHESAHTPEDEIEQKYRALMTCFACELGVGIESPSITGSIPSTA